MSYTKQKYQEFIFNTQKELSEYVEEISVTLPEDYNEENIIIAVKQYFPFEWRILTEQYRYYCKADAKLKKLGKKPRYNMPAPEQILLSLECTKALLRDERKRFHSQFLKTAEADARRKKFVNERSNKNEKRRTKIKKATDRMQMTEPEFLDQLMGLYSRKNTSQKDRVYIMLELGKYYCPKVINFFQKTVHSEVNFQLREEAVKHLLSLGHYAELRSQKYMQVHTKNRKKKRAIKNEYSKAHFDIEAIPEELEYRINNSKEQNIKSYDYFISHSSKDYVAVQSLIRYLNKKGKNVYCDWISDSDYLKRNLVCKATLDVIEKRLQQSKAVILVTSPNSLGSKWVRYELNYFHETGKTIQQIRIDSIQDESFHIEVLHEEEYIDPDFRKIKLYPDKIHERKDMAL